MRDNTVVATVCLSISLQSNLTHPQINTTSDRRNENLLADRQRNKKSEKPSSVGTTKKIFVKRLSRALSKIGRQKKIEKQKSLPEEKKNGKFSNGYSLIANRFQWKMRFSHGVGFEFLLSFFFFILVAFLVIHYFLCSWS